MTGLAFFCVHSLRAADPADDAYRRGYANLTSNQFAEASAWFQTATATTNAARAAAAWLALGESHYAAKQWSDAIAAYDVVLLKYPTSGHAPRALCSRGFAEFQGGRTNDALATLCAFTNRYPRHALAPTAAASIDTLRRVLAAQAKRRDAEAIAADLAQIDALSKTGKFSEASAAARRFLRARPDHAQAPALRYLAAHCAFQAREYAVAVDAYRDYIADRPYASLSTAALELGSALRALNRFGEAAELYAALPGADADWLCADSLYQAKRYAQAFDRYKVWGRTSTNAEQVARATLAMGDCLVAQEKWHDAELTFRRVEVQPSSGNLRPVALERLIRLYATTGRSNLVTRTQADLFRRFPDEAKTGVR
jgi:TolA-binding protein